MKNLPPELLSEMTLYILYPNKNFPNIFSSSWILREFLIPHVTKRKEILKKLRNALREIYNRVKLEPVWLCFGSSAGPEKTTIDDFLFYLEDYIAPISNPHSKEAAENLPNLFPLLVKYFVRCSKTTAWKYLKIYATTSRTVQQFLDELSSFFALVCAATTSDFPALFAEFLGTNCVGNLPQNFLFAYLEEAIEFNNGSGRSDKNKNTPDFVVRLANFLRDNGVRHLPQAFIVDHLKEAIKLLNRGDGQGDNFPSPKFCKTVSTDETSWATLNPLPLSVVTEPVLEESTYNKPWDLLHPSLSKAMTDLQSHQSTNVLPSVPSTSAASDPRPLTVVTASATVPREVLVFNSGSERRDSTSRISKFRKFVATLKKKNSK